METITRKYKVYSFKELKEEAKQTALEHFSDINVEPDGWWEDDYLLDSCLPKDIKTAIQLLMFDKGHKVERLFSWESIYFDLDRSNYLQFKDLSVEDNEVFRKFLKIPVSVWNKIEWHFEGNRECNTYLEFIYEEKSEHPSIEKAKAIFDELISDALSSLKKTYESLTGEESIIETIEANDYQFLKDGTVFN